MKQEMRTRIHKGSRAGLGLVCSLALAAALGFPVTAQETGKEPEIKSLEQLIELIPKEATRDVNKKSKQEEAARAISEALRKGALHKVAVFDLVLDFWQPWSERGEAAYRLKPLIEERTEYGTRFRVGMWIYADRESGPVIEKLKRGDKFTVTGQLTKADFTVGEGPRLHIDIERPAIVTVKK